MSIEIPSAFLLPAFQQIVFAAFGAMLWFWVSRKASSNIYATSFLNLPFTALHELAHLTVALLTFGKASKLSLMPKKNGEQYVLGSVTIEKANAINAFPIAFAPLTLLFIPIELFHAWFNFFGNSVIALIGLSFLTAAITQNAMPSKQDLRVAAQYPFSMALYTAIIIGLIFFVQTPR